MFEKQPASGDGRMLPENPAAVLLAGLCVCVRALPRQHCDSSDVHVPARATAANYGLEPLHEDDGFGLWRKRRVFARIRRVGKGHASVSKYCAGKFGPANRLGS